MNKPRIRPCAAALLLFSSAWVHAGSEGMPGMPRIEPRRVFTVGSVEEGRRLDGQRGFGDDEPRVRMMNLMMVSGSGYEGMEMEEGGGVDAKAAPTALVRRVEGLRIEASFPDGPAKVGRNTVEFTVVRESTQEPAAGLSLKSKVAMTNMDMGTTTPRVDESASGRYRLQAYFSMKGPWAVTLILPGGGETAFDFTVR